MTGVSMRHEDDRREAWAHNERKLKMRLETLERLLEADSCSPDERAAVIAALVRACVPSEGDDK